MDKLYEGLKKHFPKRKLNKCAHCDCRETTVTYGRDGHMYFICLIHWLILQAMIREAAKMGIRI